MDDPAHSSQHHPLIESWEITRRHLAAARSCLPEALPCDEAVRCEAEMNEYLEHNELGLAFESLECVGEYCAATQTFWREMLLAARQMNLGERAAAVQDRLAAMGDGNAA